VRQDTAYKSRRSEHKRETRQKTLARASGAQGYFQINKYLRVSTWSKEFLEAGKQRLAGDTARQATTPEVQELRSESAALKEVVADLTLENRLLKKSMIGDGEYEA
jgi:hypothetical protein